VTVTLDLQLPHSPPAGDDNYHSCCRIRNGVRESWTRAGCFGWKTLGYRSLDTFDGFRYVLTKQVSVPAVCIPFDLGTNMIPDGRKSTYSSLTQVADKILLMARVADPGRGSVNGRIHRAIGRSPQWKASSKRQYRRTR
jgi:hypothetical protein